MARRPRWWAFDGTLLASLVVMVGLAFALAPGPERVAILGWEIPEICIYRNVLGMSCPGCGMTRSWVYLAHGDVGTAFSMNVLGPILFLSAVVMIPVSALRLFRAWQRHKERVAEAARVEEGSCPT